MPRSKSPRRRPSVRRSRSGRPVLKAIEALFVERGFPDFRWLDPGEVVVAEWVRMKCRFGCREYGRNATCPPATPSVEECARFFREYKRMAIFHFAKTVDRPEDRHAWTRKLNLELLRLERELFLSGFVKAFLLFFDSCSICLECAAGRTACKEPRSARPTPEGMGVDVFTTVRKVGYPIDVLPDYDREMNRYAFLLVD